MQVSPLPGDRASVVAQLRAAGCVFAEEEAHLLIKAAATSAELATLVEQRVSGLPLEQVLGWADFWGVRVAVAPGVFVPRRRTEWLARQAAALAKPGAVVIDLCCGVGAVGAAMAARRQIELYAADINAVAVQCARRNLANVGGRIYEGDLYEPLPRTLQGRVNILAVNAPYVPTAAIDLMPPEARLYEPRTVLDGGQDGLDIQRRVAAEARRWLAPSGALLIETSNHQAALTAEIMADFGLSPQITRSSELEAVVVIGLKSDG